MPCAINPGTEVGALWPEWGDVAAELPVALPSRKPATSSADPMTRIIIGSFRRGYRVLSRTSGDTSGIPGADR
jgi:hypothetical protein